ncbi:DUF2304 family protein [Haloplasma contractile]|uniref:DUF2304 domain-containing protein n=1 Tax=Haloplasma contractile SSD-17B TaxID=1033810 RepID=U2DR57_9MOLU|nr:DUF2304 family protein [Haloplasma contractile]ERJ11052.1 hypothetical protein HLPCO_002873 [Haloplasma contractile SSD-17B]
MYFSEEIILIGFITFILILITIRTSKVRIKDAIFWIIWTITLIIFAFIPEANNWIQKLLGIDSNVFFFVIVVIFSYFVMFRNAIIISQHEDKIKELSQTIAIQQLEQIKINRELYEKVQEINNNKDIN